jgi:hypothetical protein
VRDHLGKLGGGLVSLGAAGALGYLITSHAVGQPSPHLTWPVWPYYLCGAMFAVGALLYGGVHGMLPWQKYHALKRRAETAESALETTRTELDKARREGDEAHRELEDAQRAAISAPAKTGLEVGIDGHDPTPFPGIGLILEIKFHVTNHDPMEHRLSQGLRAQGMRDGSSPYHGSQGVTDDPEHRQFQHEFDMIWELRGRNVFPQPVGPGQTVHGVYVTEFAWDPVHRSPDYTLVISDGRREFTARPAYAEDERADG